MVHRPLSAIGFFLLKVKTVDDLVVERSTHVSMNQWKKKKKKRQFWFWPGRWQRVSGAGGGAGQAAQWSPGAGGSSFRKGLKEERTVRPHRGCCTRKLFTMLFCTSSSAEVKSRLRNTASWHTEREGMLSLNRFHPSPPTHTRPSQIGEFRPFDSKMPSVCVQ